MSPLPRMNFRLFSWLCRYCVWFSFHVQYSQSGNKCRLLIYICILKAFSDSSQKQWLEGVVVSTWRTFYIPSVLVKENNLFGREDEVVGVECKRPIKIWDISYDSSDSIRIILCIVFSDKLNALIFKHVTIAFNINTRFYGIFR